jgi:3-polyprenyl-4-hydroxybenzoate decarboxylase
MYDPLKSLICGISGSSQGIYGVCLLSSLKICGIFGIRHSSIMPSLSPYF